MNVAKKRCQRGLVLIELVLVMLFFSLLYGLISVNLVSTKQRATLSTILTTLFTDLRQQQIKAMTADTSGSGQTENFGLYFETNRYILFRGSSYVPTHSSNFAVNLGNNLEFTNIAFSGSQIVFAKGSGEVVNFTAGTNSIALRDSITSVQKTITMNRYGVVTTVN